jgi:hypothetical protein
MRLTTTFVLLLLVGCDQGAPPFDELPLRDALRAEPEVVAAMPEAARIRLAVRLYAARASDVSVDEFDTSQAVDPAALVAAYDRIRQHRQGEPLVVGIFGNGAAWPIRDCATPSHLPSLPPTEGAPATTTATMESQALESEAGLAVRCLLAASGARRLVRIVGWPAGAIAIDETVYVNAAWLVSLAPGGDARVDGGAWDGAIGPGGALSVGAINARSGGTTPAPGGTTAGPGIERSARSLAGTSANPSDAGAATQPSGNDPQAPSVVDAVDVCAECGSGCDTSSGDSCADGDNSSDPCASSADSTDSGADPCSATSSDDSDPCSATASDGGADAASCQVARGRGRSNFGTRLWLLAPLAFLLFRRRS